MKKFILSFILFFFSFYSFGEYVPIVSHYPPHNNKNSETVSDHDLNLKKLYSVKIDNTKLFVYQICLEDKPYYLLRLEPLNSAARFGGKTGIALSPIANKADCMDVKNHSKWENFYPINWENFKKNSWQREYLKLRDKTLSFT